jgi:enamine deaminase RidA (YjgF/YER057c/UK114 family)
MMQPKVTVKAQIVPGLYSRLKAECEACGCPMSAVIQDAILQKVRDMTKKRMAEMAQLPGQLDMSLGDK